MTKEQFEVFISPTYLTFETFKQSVVNSPTTTNLNFDSIILDEVLVFDHFTPAYTMSRGQIAVLINAPINFFPFRIGDVWNVSVWSFSHATGNPILPRNCYPGAIFIDTINPPAVRPIEPREFNEFYTFLIFRFD